MTRPTVLLVRDVCLFTPRGDAVVDRRSRRRHHLLHLSRPDLTLLVVVCRVVLAVVAPRIFPIYACFAPLNGRGLLVRRFCDDRTHRRRECVCREPCGVRRGKRCCGSAISPHAAVAVAAVLNQPCRRREAGVYDTVISTGARHCCRTSPRLRIETLRPVAGQEEENEHVSFETCTAAGGEQDGAGESRGEKEVKWGT